MRLEHDVEQQLAHVADLGTRRGCRSEAEAQEKAAERQDQLDNHFCAGKLLLLF